jgi:hypothetical protein
VSADFSKLPTGAATWANLVDHALSLGDLSEVDFFELKTILPFDNRTDRKRSGALLARQILGFANRMPDVAAAHFGGFAVVLVGVCGGDVTGAQQVDGTILHDAVHPYLGDDGPHWDYQYIAHDAGPVLAIVVDPPKWGDPLYACIKDFGDAASKASLSDGDVHVRVRGRTRLATSHDLAQLGRRRDRDPLAGAAVLLQYDGKFDRTDTGTVIALVEQLIERNVDNLLAPLTSSESKSSTKSQLNVVMPRSFVFEERRSPEKFKEEVEAWRQAAQSKRDYAATEFLRHELGRGRLKISNSSDHYLETMRVEVQFPDDIRVLVASETNYCDHGGRFDFFSLLPRAPSKWGTSTAIYSPDSTRQLSTIRSPRAHWTPELEVEATPAGPVARWTLGDLRPRASETCPEAVILVTDAHLDQISVEWRATSRAVNHVYAGQLTLDCAQEQYQHLRWSPA